MAPGLPLAHQDQPQSSIAVRTRSVTSAAVAFQSNGAQSAQNHGCGRPPPSAHPHPRAGTGRRHRAAEARYGDIRSRTSGIGRRFARRNRATGGQAHGGASARRRKWARVQGELIFAPAQKEMPARSAAPQKLTASARL
jgi:hypothetical protein